MLLFIDVWESFPAIGQIFSQKWKEANRNRPLTIHEIEKNLATVVGPVISICDTGHVFPMINFHKNNFNYYYHICYQYINCQTCVIPI